MASKITLGTMISILIISFAPYFCNSRKSNLHSEPTVKQVIAKDTSLTFQDRISEIKKKVVDLTSLSDLFLIREFTVVYENPMAYIDDAEYFILNSNRPRVYKEIVVYSMNGLDIEQYRLFVSICYESFKKDNLEEDILARAIGYPFSERMVIIENYEDEGVRELLDSILVDRKVSLKLKGQVTDILSGKTWSGIKKFREESGY